MKPYTSLISTAQLARYLEDPAWVIVDCSFASNTPESGAENYQNAHIPGAVYAHLNQDLSEPAIPGVTGRHPWPSVEKAVETLSRLGIDEKMQVVAYDSANGAVAAARLWWMLRWLGHTQAAVLNGGWQKWIAEERPVRSGMEERPRRTFRPQNVHPEMLVGIDKVDSMRRDPHCRVFDTRAAERYRGENETIDPVAGHIPGARSAPYANNLDDKGVFLPPARLRRYYRRLLEEIPPQNTVFYCGSGVTALHDLLAMEYAGLSGARLYAGSWSEWIADGKRPIQVGSRP